MDQNYPCYTQGATLNITIDSMKNPEGIQNVVRDWLQ